MQTLIKILEKQLWNTSVKKYEENKSLNSILNLFNLQYIKFILHVTKCLYARYELKELFAKAQDAFGECPKTRETISKYPVVCEFSYLLVYSTKLS